MEIFIYATIKRVITKTNKSLTISYQNIDKWSLEQASSVNSLYKGMQSFLSNNKTQKVGNVQATGNTENKAQLECMHSRGNVSKIGSSTDRFHFHTSMSTSFIRYILLVLSEATKTLLKATKLMNGDRHQSMLDIRFKWN